MKWPLVSIGQCCEIVSGSTPRTNVKEYWDGEIFWATPKDLSDQKSAYIKTTARKITEAGLNSCSSTILPVGSVLLSSRAPIGLVTINTVPMCTNQGFKNLIPNQKTLHNKYLYHWLRANRQQHSSALRRFWTKRTRCARSGGSRSPSSTRCCNPCFWTCSAIR